MRSRRHSWLREEVILALELYLSLGRHVPAATPEYERLSTHLRSLPIEAHLARDPRFRNPRAVRNKLHNLQYLDSAGTRGREKGGEVTNEVWLEFGVDRERVTAAAEEIRLACADLRVRGKDEVTSWVDDDGAEEGSVVTKSHRLRERDRSLTTRKRQQVLRRTGTLACEACGFDSARDYGIPGVIECHHSKPVSQMRPGETTTLSDLRLLCPTCHRVLHSKQPWLTFDELLRIAPRRV